MSTDLAVIEGGGTLTTAPEIEASCAAFDLFFCGTRPCPKCATPVVLTAARIRHGRYTCAACGAAAVMAWSRRPENRDRFRAAASRRARAWQLKHPDRLPSRADVSAYGRSHHLAKKYGLTVADYDRLLAHQGGRCAVCECPAPGGRGRFHVDHDHATGVVRGLLCARCNLGVGIFADDPARLLRAAAYLRKEIS